MADDKQRKDEERSEEEQRWIDKLINPLEGPASENAYPEDMTIEVDGKQVSMNQSARRYNQAMGYTDKAAGTPWRGPEGKGAGTRPEGSQIRGTEEQLAEQVAERAKFEVLGKTRKPPEPTRLIEMDNADTDRPDPERQEEELMALVEAMEMIDCPCGWSGDATEALIGGSGSARDVSCPACHRGLYVITIDE